MIIVVLKNANVALNCRKYALLHFQNSSRGLSFGLSSMFIPSLPSCNTLAVMIHLFILIENALLAK